MLKPKQKSEINPFLSGNYAPVHDELTVNNLEVIGEIPMDMLGIYMRNGPNPAFEPIAYNFPFDGDGMIHAVYIEQGKAHYRNRYVKTRELLDEQRAGKAIYGSLLEPIMPDPNLISPNGNQGLFKEGTFIHIIHHANRFLAMDENAAPYEMNAKCETLGRWHPTGSNTSLEVAAHTRLDPKTGELWLIKYAFEPPFLTAFKLDEAGTLKQTIEIDKSHSTMMHDFVLTENYLIFFDCPLVIDPGLVMSGGDVMSWRPEYGTRVGIMPRSGGKINWYVTEAFLVFHFANAYEENDRVIIDFVRHNDLITQNLKKSLPPSFLYRTVIDLKRKSIKHEQLDDRNVEFPRIREDRNSQKHRFIYLPSSTNTSGLGKNQFNSIMKYDVQSQTIISHDFGNQAEIGEAVFVPRQNATSEDDGYVVLFHYHILSNSSEFIILDAQNISQPPLARVKIPRRVPHGLHGSWIGV